MKRRNTCLLVVGALAAVVAKPLIADQRIRSVEVEVEVGDRASHALCTDGPRRVVLLYGEGGSAEIWRPVLERLGSEVGACAYGRLGLAAGEHAGTRGWFELMDELQAVHSALGVEPGYVLVGHSIGGLYARLFAADRPWEVAGLVLVDPTHEDMAAAVVAGMPEEAFAHWMAERERPNGDGVREVDLARHARSSRLPDIPVTVITAMRRQDGDGWDARFLSEAARRVHASILRGHRLARHIPANTSGHDVPLEAPDLVAGEILRMARTTIRTER